MATSSEASKETKKPFRDDVFDKEIRALFEHLQNIIQTSDMNKLKMGTRNINPLMKCLKKYMTVYNRMKPIEHKDYFLKIFKEFQGSILKGHSSDQWLKENSISVVFGQGTTAANKEIRICLSAIYQISCRLKDETEERLAGLPDSARESAHELNFPDILLLHLYRLFRESADYEIDKTSLTKVLKELENELGVESEADVASTTGTSGLNDIIGSLASKMGVSIPNGALPNIENLVTGAQSLLNNPKTKDAINSIVTGLQNSKSIEDVVKNVSANVDPSLFQEITKTFDLQKMMNAAGPPSNNPDLLPPTASPPKEKETDESKSTDGPKGTENKEEKK